MTLEELVYALVLILCLAAGSVVLPVGLIVTGTASSPVTPEDAASGPVIIFAGGN